MRFSGPLMRFRRTAVRLYVSNRVGLVYSAFPVVIYAKLSLSLPVFHSQGVAYSLFT